MARAPKCWARPTVIAPQRQCAIGKLEWLGRQHESTPGWLYRTVTPQELRWAQHALLVSDYSVAPTGKTGFAP